MTSVDPADVSVSISFGMEEIPILGMAITYMANHLFTDPSYFDSDLVELTHLFALCDQINSKLSVTMRDAPELAELRSTFPPDLLERLNGR